MTSPIVLVLAFHSRVSMNNPYKRYIYNLFFDGEYVNLNGCGTLKDPLPEEILEELERTYNTLT